MRFGELKKFLLERMSMSHIYQPLLIRCLVESGGQATVRQLAAEFLVRDESQLAYYEKRLREMPIKVLGRHGVIERDGDLVRMRVPKLDLREQAEIRRICEEKICRFVEARGYRVWGYESLDLGRVADDLRYRVLKEGGSRCALCGALAKDTPLDVDHIIPKSKKGPGDISNLQILCAKCNRTKRDRDDEDFRGRAAGDTPVAGCLFCGTSLEVVEESRLALAVADSYPVAKGHTLIVPRRHVADFTGITRDENEEIFDLCRVLRGRLQREDPEISGFNFGSNAGASAGQTVMHCHYHLVPRRPGDTPDPRGGVRRVVAGAGPYPAPEAA